MITVETAQHLQNTIAMLIMYFPTVAIAGYGQTWVADKLGDSTARRWGFLTLNPLKHVDWFGLLFLIIFEFGWRKTLPINPQEISSPKRLLKLLTILFSPVLIHFVLGGFLLFLVVLMQGGLIVSSPTEIYLPASSNFLTTIMLILAYGARLNIIFSIWYTVIGMMRTVIILFTNDADVYSRTSNVLFMILSILFAWVMIMYMQDFIRILLTMIK